MNRVVLITGGTGALGRALVEAFLADGDVVATIYRKEDDLAALREETGAGEKLAGYRADVTEAATVREAVGAIVREHGRLDALVHAVGGYSGGATVAETPDDVWHRMMALNLTAAFFCARAAIEPMMERDRGAIVTIGSSAALDPQAGAAAYSASKAGLVALTRALAKEGATHGIRANVIVPGTIDTEANRKAMPDADRSKWVAPEMVAAVARFLVSEGASAVNGAVVPVSGSAVWSE